MTLAIEDAPQEVTTAPDAAADVDRLAARLVALAREHETALQGVRDAETGVDAGSLPFSALTSAQGDLAAVDAAMGRTRGALADAKSRLAAERAVAERELWLRELAGAADEADRHARAAQEAFDRACAVAVGPLSECVLAISMQSSARARFLSLAARGGVKTHRRDDPGQDCAAEALAAELTERGADLSAVRLAWGEYSGPGPFRECWTLRHCEPMGGAMLQALEDVARHGRKAGGE